MSELETCEMCGRSFNQDEIRKIDGHTVCNTCYRDAYICNECGVLIREIDVIVSECGDYYCETCYHNLFTTCDCCDSEVSRENTYITHDNAVICENCFCDSYFTCNNCGEIYHTDEMCEYNEELFCAECYESIVHYIHPHGDHPPFIYYQNYYNERIFGIELEIDCGGELNDKAEILLNIIGEKYGYFQRDGSLNDGLEFTTMPMNYSTLKSLKWIEFCKKAEKLGYKSHDARTCGLHVHVNRRSLTSNAETNLVTIFEKFWEILKILARRNEKQLNKWAKRYFVDYNKRDNITKKLNEEKYYGNRYYAVNVTNPNTIEFRIFNGTLKPNTIIATVQLVNLLCDIANTWTTKELLNLSDEGFVRCLKGNYAELDQYLKERGF